MDTDHKPHTGEDSDQSTEFLKLLSAHDRSLSLYVYGLVTHQADADDILQQTKMVIWRSFSQFQPGTNFIAWARKIAFHQILGYRRKKKKQHLPLSDEMLDMVGEEIAEMTDHEYLRKQALQSCLNHLKADHRKMMLMRYQEEMEIEDIAKKSNSTPGAVYRALSRLRLSLLDCINTRLKSETTLS